MSPEAIVAFFHARRFPLTDEKILQARIAECLGKENIEHEREVRLAPGDIVDFMIGGVAIEVKIGGRKRSIYDQCERYCEHERVEALVLATSVAMGFPPEIKGKPCYVASLGRGWL